MKRPLILMIFLYSVELFAVPGNEAGGRWISHRFRARALEALSVLCQEKRGTFLEESKLHTLEDLVESSKVIASPSVNYSVIFDRDSSDINLGKKVWAHYFFSKVRFDRDILALYLSRVTDDTSAILKRGFDRIFSEPKFREVGSLKGNPIAFLKTQVPFESAVERCKSRGERLLGSAELESASEALVRQITKIDFVERNDFVIWTTSGRMYDLFGHTTIEPSSFGDKLNSGIRMKDIPPYGWYSQPYLATTVCMP